MTNEAIEVQLIESNVLTRWPCDVCGGWTEKVQILAEVTEGEHKGFRVCERCIAERDFDVQLEARARWMEREAADTRDKRWKHEAAKLRGVIGRLQVPSLEDYNRAIVKCEDTA